MPLEVKIPKEITEYKEKIFLGMSVRQLICFAIAVVVGLITYFAARPFIGNDLAEYLVFGEVMPIMGIGFIRVNGFAFERYLMIFFKHYFGSPIRTYRTELSVDLIDYYTGYELGTEVNSIVSKVKKENYRRIGNEATDSSYVDGTKKEQKRKLKAIKRTINEARIGIK